jgi:TolB-like protein/Tfp pilus assembly protein PilF
VPSSPQISFSEFRLDLTSGELYRNGEKVTLPPKAFLVLRTLAERPGRVVTRDELRARLWASDTYVEFDDSLNHAVKDLRRALGDSVASPRFIETLPRYGYRFLGHAEARLEPVTESGAVTPIRALAVLPLANLTGDPQQDYFADGMTDALITDLAKIRSVKVISRTSAMQFKDVKKPLPEIARALGVDVVLEGSVQRSGGRVRITAQLIRGANDIHLWADSYEREAQDILSLQSEIAKAVAREINIALTPEESGRLGVVRQVNPEAYEAYLKGQAHWYRISPEHLDAALEYFQLALEKDPTYVRAYVGVANVWIVRGDAGSMAPMVAFSKAKEFVARALQLDDTLAEAHATLATIVGPYDRDWSRAEQEFLRAIDLNPNSADAHFMFADHLISMRQTEAWNSEIRGALELDPFNPFFQCFYGWQLAYLGRYDDAITQLNNALKTELHFSSAHLGLWGAYFKKGMQAEALAEAQKFFAVLSDREIGDALGRGAAKGDYMRAMHWAADVLAERARRTYVPAVRIARLYAHAGEKEKTLKWLQEANERRESPLMHLGVAGDWDFLREDHRFHALLGDLGLPQ